AVVKQWSAKEFIAIWMEKALSPGGVYGMRTGIRLKQGQTALAAEGSYELDTDKQHEWAGLGAQVDHELGGGFGIAAQGRAATTPKDSLPTGYSATVNLSYTPEADGKK
ncbi:MAG: hypothetical protein AABZ44_05390, partial [Elusimicrobiota bacterium]